MKKTDSGTLESVIFYVINYCCLKYSQFITILLLCGGSYKKEYIPV